MTDANKIYQNLILDIFRNGETTETRNSKTISNIFLPSVTFDSFPLVTIRKTAWKKAIREMEWFLDGDTGCPNELLDWWAGQLNPHNRLLSGYGFQFRYSSFYNWEQDELSEFDQIEFLIKNIKEHSNSRRLILTSWNPGEMANITETNSNPNTPTTCHNTCTQFFVRGNKLHLKTYQRSADMLLGVPHNWEQTWAMLLYFANKTGFEVGTMQWIPGDAHIYLEESHLEVANSILKAGKYQSNEINLIYNPSSEAFLAKDFTIDSTIPDPVTTVRPKLI